MSGKEYYRPTPEEQAAIDRIVGDVERNIGIYTQILTRASRLAQLSHTLAETARLKRNLHEVGLTSLGWNFDDPLLIVVPGETADGTAADQAVRNDPRTIVAEAIVGERISQTILGSFGLDTAESVQRLFKESSEKIAGQIVHSLSGLGRELYHSIDQFSGEDSLRGHGFSEIQSIDASPLGFNARLVRTPDGTPPGQYGFEVTLGDLDGWRLDHLKVLGMEVYENPGVRESVRMLLGGVILERVFPTE